MRESSQTFWVGLFMIFGLVALAVLVVLFGQVGFVATSSDAYVVNVRFDRATGIRRGTQATIGGIPVGRVIDVGFPTPGRYDEGVHVGIVFDDGVQLYEGARAMTNEPGLGEGRPPIRIEPGPRDAPQLVSGALIPGDITTAVEQLIPPQVVSNFDRTATRIGDAAAALTPVLNDLHEVMQPRSIDEVDMPGGPQGNLSTAVARLDSSLRHFNDVLGDPEVKSQLRESFDNIHTMTEDGKVVMTEMKNAAGKLNETATDAKVLIERTSATVEHIDAQAERLARSLVEDLELASNLLTRVNTIMDGVQRGEGTAGKLFTDDRLYESLVLAFDRLSATAEEFRLLVKEWQKGKVRVGL